MREYNYLDELNNRDSFNRKDLFMAMQSYKPEITEANFKVKLKKMLDDEQLVRVGRNSYCVCEDGIERYTYDYSDMSKRIVELITDNHPDLDFRIFELVQLNEFLNHQIAHNTTFVFVESDLGGFVFDTLRDEFQGKLLINPTKDMYHQYWTDDMVVIMKLLSESPKSSVNKWDTCMEKMIVDILYDKIITSTYPLGERGAVVREIFNKYVVDESKMFRYARRRGAEKKLKEFLVDKANVELRTEKNK